MDYDSVCGLIMSEMERIKASETKTSHKQTILPDVGMLSDKMGTPAMMIEKA